MSLNLHDFKLAPSKYGLEVESDADTRRDLDSTIPSETFWDCSPYSDLAQTWPGTCSFSESAEYCRGKNSTLAIPSQPFFDAMNYESSPHLFTCQESFPVEPYALKQAAFGWRAFLSPDLTSVVDDSDTCSPFMVQGTGQENIPPSPDSPTLDDFAGFPGDTSIWADSLSARFGTHGTQKLNLAAQEAFVGTPGSPTSMCLPHPATPSQGRRKGLFGWGDTSDLRLPTPVPSNFLRQNRPCRPRSSSLSSDIDTVLDPLTLDASLPIRKRQRQSSLDIKSESSSLHSSDEESDSDDYRPSRSPSPNFERFRIKPSAAPTLPPKPVSKRGTPSRSKKKRSAALALAVVTQIREAKREAEALQVSLDPDSFDPVRVYLEGSYVMKKRKNQPIPLPVPVPNLNKKCRGRKVPYVANESSPVLSSTLNTLGAPPVDNFGGQLHKPSRLRRKVQTSAVSDKSDKAGTGRSYVCVVPGCGKGFVRGEHLKRHVRSIHTNDKPHVCPFGGCDKSFSRRDNLGQHVRVHLQT